MSGSINVSGDLPTMSSVLFLSANRASTQLVTVTEFCEDLKMATLGAVIVDLLAAADRAVDRFDDGDPWDYSVAWPVRRLDAAVCVVCERENIFQTRRILSSAGWDLEAIRCLIDTAMDQGEGVLGLRVFAAHRELSG